MIDLPNVQDRRSKYGTAAVHRVSGALYVTASDDHVRISREFINAAMSGESRSMHVTITIGDEPEQASYRIVGVDYDNGYVLADIARPFVRCPWIPEEHQPHDYLGDANDPTNIDRSDELHCNGKGEIR